MKKLKLRKNVKVITTLLCFGMLVSVLPTMNVVAEDTESANEVADDRTVIVSASDNVLYKDDSVELNAEFDGTENTEYQWQIYIAASDLWVNISGANEETLTVTYAMAANASLDDEVSFRVCVADFDGKYTSESLTLNIADYNTFEESETQSTVSSFSLNRNLSLGSDNSTGYSITPYADSNDSIKTVTVQFLFRDESVAAEPDVSSVATGTSLNREVPVPKVIGYQAVDANNEPIDKVIINESKIENDIIIKVYYVPTIVEYKVSYYYQNVNDDEYTDTDPIVVTINDKTESDSKYYPFVRCTGETIDNGLQDLQEHKGFFAKAYDFTQTVAADGSTDVSIYYDRMYYLISFDLGGGYGVEPIYARYGTAIPDVGTPVKAGYTFAGWSLDGVSSVTLPKTIDDYSETDGKRTYIALWTPNDTAKVTVVFWGENADDNDYSYLRSMQVFPKPGEEYKFDGSTVTCPYEEHTHSADCCSHTHTLDCYYSRYGLTEITKPQVDLKDNGNNIYTYTSGLGWNQKTHYYLCLNDTWYCGKTWGNVTDDTISISYYCSHTHSDDCYKCGLKEHTHTSECSNKWNFFKSDTIIVSADGSSIVNVYYKRTVFTLNFYKNSTSTLYGSITAKWGADIQAEYNIIVQKYNCSMWDTHEDGKTGPYTNNFPIMPVINTKSRDYYTHSTSGKYKNSMIYYLQALDPNSYTQIFKTEWNADSYYEITKEDYYEFNGFTIDYNLSSEIGDNCDKYAKFYYTRNSYTLTFNDGYDDIKTILIKYQSPLGDYNFTPSVPSAYQPGSVVFDGWYLNPECTGEKFILNEHTMPANNLLLYAKWVPVEHDVNFYWSKNEYDKGQDYTLSSHPSITVKHGNFANPVPADLSDEVLSFIGWFYMEDGQEKAFDFKNMPVTKDMDVYGKWFSDRLLQYEIKYCAYDENGSLVEIADHNTGVVLASDQKTVEAKTGTELYENGYFPKTRSHSIGYGLEDVTVEKIDENKIILHYTFIYEKKDSVPYIVRYLTKDATGAYTVDVHSQKKESTTNSIITETYVQVKYYIPDAYQKRLILVASDNPEDNVLDFYYEYNDKIAFISVTHKIQNQIGSDYHDYQSFSETKAVKETYTTNILELNDYIFERAEINGKEVKPNYDEKGNPVTVSDTVTIEGMNIVIYYKCKTKPLTITKTVDEIVNQNQSFLFTVSGENITEPISVLIHGKQFSPNGDGTYSASVVISDVRVGNIISVKENTDWCWRYEPVDSWSKKITIDGKKDNIVEFTNRLNNQKWLTDEAYKENQFTIKQKGR